MAFGAPGIAYSAVVPAPGLEGRPWAQTGRDRGPDRYRPDSCCPRVAAMITTPSLGTGCASRGDHDRGPVTRDCLALTTVHNDMPHSYAILFIGDDRRTILGNRELWPATGNPTIQPTIIPGGHQAPRRIMPGPYRVPHKVATRPCQRPLPQRTSSIAFSEPSPQPWMPGRECIYI